MASPAVSMELVALIDLGGLARDASALRDRVVDLAAGKTRAVVIHGFEQWTATADPDILREIELASLPLVASFEGRISGPALDLALATDVRVAGAGASIAARNIGNRRLLTLLGQVSSVQLFESGGSLDGGGLLAIGLISDLVPAGEALERAIAIASVIASRGPIATRFAKEAIWRGVDLPLDHALRFETDLTLLLQTTKDRAEGVRAFIEKRPPIFTGD